MMRGTLSNLKRDCSGSTIVEFAVVAPVLLAMLCGVLQMGIVMWSYNSMRGIAADTARYTMIEYQKKDALSESQIEDKAVAIAVNSPYDFEIDNFDPHVTTPASDVAGLTKFQLTLTYTPPTALDFTGITAPAMSITRAIYVAT
jgi:Flp pilus assembly protein TadG